MGGSRDDLHLMLPDKLQPLCNRVVGFTSIAEAAGVGGAFAGKSD
jgi:hypothetical protein